MACPKEDDLRADEASRARRWMTGALRPLLHAAADRIPWLDRLRSERHLRN